MTCQVLKIDTSGGLLPQIVGKIAHEYSHIKEMQKRLKERAIGSKREFLKEIIREVRVRGKEITLTYRLPWAPASVRKRTKVGGSLHYQKWWSQ